MGVVLFLVLLCLVVAGFGWVVFAMVGCWFALLGFVGLARVLGLCVPFFCVGRCFCVVGLILGCVVWVGVMGVSWMWWV